MIIVTILIVVIVANVIYDTNVFKVNKLTIQTNKFAAGEELSFVQITDVHGRQFGKNNAAVVKKVKQLQPAFVVLTGDLIDRSTSDLEPSFTFVEQLVQLGRPVYYVSGNHEWDNVNAQSFFQGLAARKVTILNNRHVTITNANVKLSIVGVDDSSTSHENVDQAFANVDEQLFTLLLAHDPMITSEYPNLLADLTVSGHTHGGQIRLPFVGSIVVPGQPLFPTFDKGLFPLSNERQLYIDSGLGTTILPMRFYNQSQISYVTLRSSLTAK